MCSVSGEASLVKTTLLKISLSVWEGTQTKGWNDDQNIGVVIGGIPDSTHGGVSCHVCLGLTTYSLKSETSEQSEKVGLSFLGRFFFFDWLFVRVSAGTLEKETLDSLLK